MARLHNPTGVEAFGDTKDDSSGGDYWGSMALEDVDAAAGTEVQTEGKEAAPGRADG